MQVHRLQAVQIADDHACRDAQGATQGDPQMRKVATDPDGSGVDINRRQGVAGAARHIFVGLPQPGFDGGNLVIAQPISGSDRGGHLIEMIGFAVAAGEQKVEHAIRQQLHIDKGAPGALSTPSLVMTSATVCTENWPGGATRRWHKLP